MRLVDRPVFKPMRCAALPYVGQTHGHTRWIDTGSELDGFDNHVYVSSVAVDEFNRLLGNPTRQAFGQLKADLIKTVEECDELQRRLEEAEAQIAAVETLKTAGLLAPTRQKAAA
jgi:hypothetical protein